MKFNHYTIAALPQLTWDGDLPCSLADLLEEFDMQLEPLRDGIRSILLLDDIRNIELIIKSRLAAEEGKVIDFFRAGMTKPEELELFVDDPRHNAPDGYPEFIEDFFESAKTNEERNAKIEELYTGYYTWMSASKNPFLARYGANMMTVYTVVSALRMLKNGTDLDKHLKGDSDAVKLILETGTTQTSGLKAISLKSPKLLLFLTRRRLRTKSRENSTGSASTFLKKSVRKSLSPTTSSTVTSSVSR